MQCPKCSYTRLATDDAPPGMCPSCGLIYAKYVAPAPKLEPVTKPQPAKVSAPKEESPQTPDGAQSRWESILDNFKQVPVWAVSLVFGVLVGYFMGREHIKYELRAAIEVATDGIRRSFGSAERKPQASTEPSPFTILLTGKIFREADFPKVQAATVFGLTVDNLTGKDVRAFDGRLIFKDLLDSTILETKLTITDPVKASSQLKWVGNLEHNQFLPGHKIFKSTESKDIRVSFEPNKILFSDGTIKQY